MTRGAVIITSNVSEHITIDNTSRDTNYLFTEKDLLKESNLADIDRYKIYSQRENLVIII